MIFKENESVLYTVSFIRSLFGYFFVTVSNFLISDNDTPFMRIGSEENVNEYWVSVRSELTQDYKRKRKDAVRRQNKLAAKRTRYR